MPFSKSTFLPTCLAALALGCGFLHAQQTDVPAALKQAESDLKDAMTALEKTRQAIAAEKPKITADFRKTEQELLEKRRLVRIARLSKDDRAQELRQLQSDLSTRRQDANYLSSLLKDHALKTSTLSTPGAPELQVGKETIAAEINDPTESLSQRLAILDASVAHIEEILGGSTAPGKAADPSGKIADGTFAALGPLSYFLSENKSAGGDVIPSKTDEIPHYVPGNSSDVAALITGKAAALPLDPTGGNARAMDEINDGFADLVRKGGLWVWPIMFLALISIIFGLIKLAQFSRFREPTDAWIGAILAALRAGDRDKAQKLASNQRHPSGAVMEKLVSVSENSADLVEETLYEQLMEVQSKASSLLSVIAVTAATSPLLGLLGTVSGMIATFNLITLFGSGDPKPLASGISEALITTLFGLVVAIPALILHAFLSRRAQGIVQTTERLGLSLVNGLRAK
jgi:biopolymer transport protein ExbB